LVQPKDLLASWVVLGKPLGVRRHWVGT
jgi:hypothetical protein